MTTNQIYERLTPVFRDVFDDDTLVVTPQLSAANVPGWDSLTHLRLILSIERTFSIKFAAAEVAKLENVGDLVAVLTKRCP